MARRRLDAELVRRGLARSREQARELIESGRVRVRGSAATKAATQVDEADAVLVVEADEAVHYVSRGAHKLIGALDRFAGIDVAGRSCLDAGASTGGFTQVLLERGAARVLAVDVGYGQLAWPVRTDARVTVLERTNVRGLTVDQVPFRPDLLVADLSFIPLGLVIPALSIVAADECDLVLMVKPQFEVGRADVGDGVVRDAGLRASAVRGVAHAARTSGLGVRDVVASPLPGPSGNVEYFLWLARPEGRMGPMGGGFLSEGALDIEIDRAVREGPQ
ncbi:MAG: TlyA family RNA methyltransferase [Actinomycetota bacterium]|nr:TlyA family RNA methyltransferase [Actinomycetota bacterium]